MSSDPSGRSLKSADFVAEVFCPSECVRLIQDQPSMRNVDSRIHSLRFDCCVFLFQSFSTVTFATQSANRDRTQRSKISAYSIPACGRACEMMSVKRAGGVPGGAKPRYLPSGSTRKMKPV